MPSSSGLSVRKPVTAWNKSLKTNFKDAFKALGKAGVDAATGNWVGVGKDAIDALSAVGLESKEPEALAWALIFNSLKRAMFRVAAQSQNLMTNIREDVDALTEQLDLSFESRDLEITEDFFDYPEQLPVLKDIQLPFQQWFEGVGVATAQGEALSHFLPSEFVFSLNDEWRRHAQEYGRITEVVITPFTQADSRERG